MAQRKHQFLGFVVILLLIGFLQYVRKIVNGYKLSKTGKILYLATMVVFTVGTMFVLYYSEVSNIVSFLLGLLVTATSEHIARLFLIIGDNFNPIIVKLVKKYFKIDLSEELNSPNNPD